MKKRKSGFIYLLFQKVLEISMYILFYGFRCTDKYQKSRKNFKLNRMKFIKQVRLFWSTSLGLNSKGVAEI